MAFPEDLEFCQLLVKLEPYLPAAQDAIQIIIEELKCGSIRNWGNIRAVLSHLYRRRFPRKGDQTGPVFRWPINLKNFIFSVLTLFAKHKYFDKSVISDVLEFLCLYHNPVFHHEIRFNENNDQTSMSTFEKSVVFSYKDIPSLVPPIVDFLPHYHWGERLAASWHVPSYYNWVELLAGRRQVHLLRFIISYGATLIVPQILRVNPANYALFIDRYLKKIRHFETDEEVTSFAYRIIHNFETKFDERYRRRLYFVQRVVFMYSKVETDAYVKCARIFMSCTPEPLITSEEVKSFLTKLCGSDVSSEEVLQFVEEYESHFPESRQPSTPRSLKHLSRFQVRESLRTAKSFPHGVQSLFVPKKIQDYICFNDILFR